MKKKIIALVLCIAIIIGVTPVVSAQTVGDAMTQSITNEQENINQTEIEPYIVGELTEKRTENTKHFLMSDRSIMASMYDEAVHYNDNGAWVDIDNSFSTNSENEFENKNNSFKTKFSKKSNGNKLVTIKKDNYSLSWKLDDANKVNAEISQANETETEDISVLKNLEGSVTYPEIQNDVDLQYVVSGENIKENIILQSAEAPTEYSFTYKFNKLQYRTNDNNQIEFYDESDSENVVFIIDKPYMYDSANAYSSDIEMKISKTNNGFKLTLVPNKEWLLSKDRVYPVVIDPTTLSSQKATSVWDIEVRNTQTSAFWYKAGDFLVGSDSSGQVYRTLLKFCDLPNIGTGGIVVNAKMNITAYQGPAKDGDPALRTRPTDDIQVNVHRITANWPEQGVVWNDYANSYNSIVEDYFIYNDTDEAFVADITEIVSGWYEGTYGNYGVMLKANNEAAANHVMQFASSDWGVNNTNSATWRPILLVNYRTCIGLEDYWSYTTQDMGGYGTGYINNYNGNLTYIHNDISFNSLINGFTLSHVFNSALSYNGTGRYGNGWGLNLVQHFEPITIDGNNNVKFVYTDGDGTKHYFVQLDDGSIVDEDGLGYTYTNIQASGSELFAKITDKDGNTLIFDIWYALRAITDTNGNTINLNYSPVPYQFNYLSTITTSSGGAIYLHYDNEYKLSYIVDNAGRATYFSYTDGNLTKITYPDNTVLNLSYSGNNLCQITLPDGRKQCYFYYPNLKISAENFKSSDGTMADQLCFNYYKNQTETIDLYARKITYQFDSFGRVSCAYDSQGNSYSETYEPDSTDKNKIFSNNKLSNSSNNKKYINNLITNPAFLDGLSSWGTYIEAPNETQISVVNDQTYISSNNIKISSTASSIQTLLQTPNTTAGKTYTISANIKTENIVSSIGRGAAIEVVTNTSSGQKWYLSDFVSGTTDTLINGGYKKLTVTVNLAPDEYILRIGVGLYHASGTVWIDGVQVEEGDTANAINLISNSSFEGNSAGTATPSCFSGCAGGVVSADTSIDGNNSYRITGNATQRYNTAQTIALSGKKGDAFSFGCWTKANAVASHDNSGSYKLVLQISTTNGNQWVDIFFNEHVNEWQFGSKVAIAENDYSSISIYACYYLNCNTAYFDNLFLYRDTAQSYEYDENGNVISTADYAKQQSTFEYTNNNSLSKILNPTGTGYEYAYDSNKNLIVSRSSEGVQSNIIYDSQGNALSTLTGSNNFSSTIQDGKTYYIRLKESGKYLTVENGGTSILTKVIQSDFSGADNQKWHIEKNNDGTFTFSPLHAPHMAMDVYGGSNDELTTVEIYTKNSTNAQKFTILPRRDYTYAITPKCSTDGKILTVNGSDTQSYVTILSPQGELNGDQAWYFEDVEQQPTQTVEDGMYQIRIKHSGKYVDLCNGVTDEGTVIQQYENNFTAAQYFEIKQYNNTEYFTITPYKAQNTLVSVSNDLNENGCELVKLSNTEISDNKLFKFVYNSTIGAFQIVPKSNENECFDITYSYKNNGIALVTYMINNGSNQGFLLELVSDIITSSATYQNNGNHPHTVTDSRGNTTTYTYDSARGLQTGVTDAKGNLTEYVYNNSNDRLNSVTSGDSSVVYYYNSVGRLTGIESPSGTKYFFIYDEFGNTKEIDMGPAPLITNTYDTVRGLLNYSVYGNGQKIGYTYDVLDRITEKLYNDVVKVEFRYDKFGNLYEKQDLFTNTTYRYDYDLIGRVMGVKASNNTSIHYVYDDFNRVERYVAKIGDNTSGTEYIYGDNAVSGQKNGLIYGVKQNGTQRISYAYDSLARLQNRTLNTTTPFVTEYGYHAGATDGTTTTLIKTVKNGNDIYEYSYDTVGNITQIEKNGALYESYTYDNLNQLKTVTRGSDTYAYTYDNGGNIQSVTLNGNTVKSYTYGDSEWRDLLTAYNGQTITYDYIGNPLQYRDGYSFTWSNGRQLTGITKGTDNISYLYNAEGLRTSKTVNGTTTDYYWLEGMLLGQKTGNDYIIYLYDENGSAYGIICNNTYYYYVFNAQGDVVGIIDQSGTQVVQYDYSAWGEVLSITGTMADTLGQQNPIRYRGYYYDSETGFYLTGTRYYDPEIGRFINADGQINDDILGTNLFAYCGNNPVTRADDTGRGWWVVAGALIGGIAGGVTKIVSNVTTGKKWNEGVIGATVGGAVYGGVLAATGNVWAAGFASAAAESLTNEVVSYIPKVSQANGQTVTKKVTTGNVIDSTKTVLNDTAVNGTISAVTGKIAGKIVPTNNGWFKPQKFVSSFAGKYAIKSELQTLTQSGLLFGVEGLKYSFNQRLKQGQQPIVTFFPDTEIRAAG